MNSRLFRITLGLLAFTQAVVPRVANYGAAASDGDATTDTSEGSLSVLYLEQLLQKFKESDRKFQNGEMNLLPDETKGFANTAHCILAQNHLSLAKADRDASRRTLQFNFSLKPLQNVLATQLVLLVPETTSGSATSAYKVKQNGTLMRALDSKLASAAIPHKEQLEFSIQYVTGDMAHDLFFGVEVAEQNRTRLPSDRDPGALLDSITPLLVVYTHDRTSIGQPTGKTQEPALESGNVRKRQAVSLSPTLEEIENEPCQRYQTFLTYEQIGWPSSHVISPPGGLNFAYCYGRCNSPFSEESEYTRHAQLLEASKNYYKQNNLPPPVIPSPCCVPIALTNINIITETTEGRIAGKVFQDVERCGCV